MDNEVVSGQRTAFGASRPSVTEIPALGGIRFELDNGLFVTQNEHEHHFIMTGATADCELLIVDRDGDGNPIKCASHLITAASKGGGTPRELPSKELGGFPARVFDVQRPKSAFYPSLRAVGAKLDEDGWSAPRAARLWIADTDRGLVMISAEAFESPKDLPPVIATCERIVSTLEFVDPFIDLS